MSVTPIPQNELCTDHECAVLFIDVRGSTKDSTQATRTPKSEADRILKLFNIFKQAVVTENCDPNFIKSTGDGLMSVWHLDDTDRLERLAAVARIATGLQRI
jgi:class 3 adenylate cyclase